MRLVSAEPTFKEVTLSAPSSAALSLAAKTIRVLTADAVQAAGIGHLGLPLGCAELGALLYAEVLRHDPLDPSWPDRDRFVLSAGHGSMLLYSLLHLSGYALELAEIRRFRQLGSKTPGHPEWGVTPGVETTTGPLGQGLANGVGMALSERMLAQRLGPELVDHRTYVLASDGDLMEGVASEAASLAGHLGLGRLTVLYDDNGITIDGPTSRAFSEDVARRFEAYGWQIQRADGHSFDELRSALSAARASEEAPQLILCRTEIGRGSAVAGQAKAHGSPGDEVLRGVRERLEWTHPPFVVPEEARGVFAENASRGRRQREAWQQRLEKARGDAARAELLDALYGRKLPENLEDLLPAFSASTSAATRAASGQVINALAPSVPGLVGGSADLAGSNNTTQSGESFVEREQFGGRNLAFGVREHGMAAAVNGMALHGGLRPYVATFLVFSDYLRPALRLSALMRQPVIYILTHDSIFVGEDGPTHQPVEHVAALRTIPNLEVWRPADAQETAYAWIEALRRDTGPTALVLSRQSLPGLEGVTQDGVCAGAYVLVREPDAERLDLVLVATGSEVHLATAAAHELNASGHSVRVVSLPCLERLLAMDAEARDDLLPRDVPRLGIEAGVEQGLAPVLGRADAFHGLSSFGESAPYEDLAEHFGLTPSAVLEHAKAILARG